MKNIWDKFEKTQLKLLGNLKLTQMAKLLTKFCLLLLPGLIFQPLSILYGFSDHLFYFFTIYFAIFHHGAQYLTSYYSFFINRCRTPTSEKFRQLLFSFRKVWGYPTLLIS